MKYYSPLRYPGGKRKLAKFITLICKVNNISGHYVEPYAGGASVALFLLAEGYVKEITINDKDRSIYAFWYSVLHYTEKLCELIEKTDITIGVWNRYKIIQRNKRKFSLLKLGFSTLFLNRTNISGILDAGVIGGIKQAGRYKIDCRFNKKELVRRIRLIASYKRNIRLFNLDALELVNKIQNGSKSDSTIYYFDPPYYLKGESLYLNHYKHDDHVEVSKAIKKLKNARWIVSYDVADPIKKMYQGYKKIEYSIIHTARVAKKASEILFFSNNLIVPQTVTPVDIHQSAQVSYLRES